MTQLATLPVRHGVITLLTDFGLADPFVGVMKGVIITRFPEARIIDLCHGVTPQQIEEGAFWLERSFGWFPPGTVHVAVVDPGVGSVRRAIAVRAAGHYFVAPDNGILSAPLWDEGAEVRAIDWHALGLPEPSRTFHGRDIFAPVAAELASGRVRFDALGNICRAERAALERCIVDDDRIDGKVVAVDRFGNLITNIEASLLDRYYPATVWVGGRVCPIVETYSTAAEDELLALVNAFGTLEVAVRNGSAAGYLGLTRGAPVRVERTPIPLRTF
ncbi:MAG TPA: SAM-dependent chlorinase/fluorinase [Polyangiaceae bacterium]